MRFFGEVTPQKIRTMSYLALLFSRVCCLCEVERIGV